MVVKIYNPAKIPPIEEEEESEYDSSEELDEDEAWRLLMEQERQTQVVVRRMRKETLVTHVRVDLPNGNVLEGEAVVDTGSVLSFLNIESLNAHAPDLLKALTYYPLRITGISGENVRVLGTVSLPCVVAGKAVEHRFVVADVVEPILMGLDFMQSNKATWDWLTGNLVYQEIDNIQEEHACRLIKDEELSPNTIDCLRVKVCGTPNHDEVIHLQPYPIPHEGLVVGDVLGRLEDNSIQVVLENRTDQPQTLPAGLMVGCWTPQSDIKQIIPLTTSEVTTYRTKVSCNQEGATLQKSADVPVMEELVKTLPTTGGDLPQSARQAALELFEEYTDVFALKSSELGRTNLVEHEIDVGDSRPIRLPPRRVPLHKLEVVESALQEMEEKGVIRASHSPWSAPIVIVQKKDGSARFCVDYRALNEKTRKDAYPIPRVEDNLDALEGSRWFSTLDLAAGYWQVAVAEKDKPKTAFTTKFGLYEFNVLPFGLTNGPATFQRLMERVLKGLQWRILVLYLDDIVIFSKTWEEHVQRLRQVFQRLREAGLKLKPKKCQLFRTQVGFLGHIIDGDGIHTDPDKIRTIQDWPTPSDLHEVRVFLGLTSYYRRFVKDYASVASPLYELTRKGVEFEWQEPQEQAFQDLKRSLVEHTRLAYPQLDGGEYILDTDASGNAIGAVLSQVQDGEEQVLAFGSRCLSEPERNYCVTRKELLAVVYFMCYYKHYLLGTTVTVRSDHGSLRWLKNMRNPTGQVARWIERLAPFNWQIVHRAGKQHSNADALSRKRCEGDCPQCVRMWSPADSELYRNQQLLSELEEQAVTINRGKTTKPAVTESNREWDAALNNMWDREELLAATSRDSILGELLCWAARPNWEEIAGKSREVKHYWQLWPSRKVVVSNGLIWYRWDEAGSFQWKLVIPRVYQSQVLTAFHDLPSAGHLGEKRSVHSMRKAPVYWFQCYQDMRLHCRCCEECLRCKPMQKKARAPMQSFTAGEPVERMALDIMGELHQTKDGNRYILVVMDYFTKYAHLIPLPNHQAKTVALALVKEVFTKVGIPRSLHSDRGTDFMSQLFQETCRLFNVEKTHTTPWRPQSDGMVERLNRTLGSMLKQYVSPQQDDWDEFLPLVALAYNSSRHSSTSYSPNYLMFGRDFRVPLELVLPLPGEELDSNPGDDSLDHFISRMAQVFKHVYGLTREHLHAAMKVQKHYYNRKAAVRKFQVGQSVWLYNPKRRKGRSPKLDKPWEGPYAVVRLLGEVLCEIQLNRRCKSKVVHVDKLVSTRVPVKMDWVFKLPRSTQRKETPPSNIYEGVQQLFQEPVEQISSVITEKPEKARSPKRDGSVATEKPEVVRSPDADLNSVIDSVVMDKPEEVRPAEGNLDFAERSVAPEKELPTAKVTRSGKQY